MQRFLLCLVLLALVCDSSNGQDTLRVLVHESPIAFDQSYEDSLFAEDFQTAFNQIFEAADFDGDGDMDFYTNAYVSRSASVSVEYFSLFQNESGSGPRLVLQASNNFRIDGQLDPSAVGDLNGDEVADFVVGSTNWHDWGQDEATKPGFYGESDYSPAHVLLSQDGGYRVLAIPGTEWIRTGTFGILPVSSDDTEEVVITTGDGFKVFEIENGSVVSWMGHEVSLLESSGLYLEAAEVLSLDVDGDEDRDLVVVYSQPSDGRTWVTWMPAVDGEVDFGAEVLLGQLDVSAGFVIAANEEAVRAADFDGDGKAEVIIWWIDNSGDGSADEYLSVHEVSDSGLQDVTLERFPSGRNWDRDNWLGTGIQLADLNGDGFTDIVPEQGWGWGSEYPSIFINDGSGILVEKTLDLQGIRSKGAFPKPIDFDGDGFFEILFAPVISDASLSEIQLAQIVFPEMAPSRLWLGSSDADTLRYDGGFESGAVRLPIQIETGSSGNVAFELGGRHAANFRVDGEGPRLVNTEALADGTFSVLLKATDQFGSSIAREFVIEVSEPFPVSVDPVRPDFFLATLADWPQATAFTQGPVGFNSGGFTVSAWIRASTTGAFEGLYFGGEGVLIGLQEESDPQARLSAIGRLDGATGEFSIFLNEAEIGVRGLPADVWHNVILRSDGGEISLWVNGAVRAVDGIDGGNVLEWILTLGKDGPADLSAGRSGLSGALYSSVSVYDRALSSSEIERLIQGGTSGGLIGHWGLDEGAGKLSHNSVDGGPHLQRGLWEEFDGGPSSPLVWRSAEALEGRYWDLQYDISVVDLPPFRFRDLDGPTAGDLDADGDIDLIYHGANNADCFDPSPSEGFLVFTNLGDGLQASWHSYDGTPVYSAGDGGPLWFDAVGNSLPDLIILDNGIDNPCESGNGLHIFENESGVDDASFRARPDAGMDINLYPRLNPHHSSIAVDLDQDGYLDILSRGQETLVYVREDSGFVERAHELLGYNALTEERGWVAAALDMDGNGMPELLMSGQGERADVILGWNADSLRYTERIGAVRWTNYAEHRPQVRTLDIDADGDFDLISYAAQGIAPIRLRVFENIEGQYFRGRDDWDIVLEDGHISRWTFGDVNGDGYLDVLADPASWNGGMRMWLFQPQYGFFDAAIHFPPTFSDARLRVIRTDESGAATKLYLPYGMCTQFEPQGPCSFHNVIFSPTSDARGLWAHQNVPTPVAPRVVSALEDAGQLTVHVSSPSLSTCHEIQVATDQAFREIVYRQDCYAPDSLTTPGTFDRGLFVRVRSHLAARISPWSATVAVGAARLERPLARVDAYDLLEDEALSADAAAGVLANDSTPSSYELQAVLVDSTANGVLALASDGSFAYTPEHDLFGEDSFAYFATDGYDSTAVAQVSLTIAPVNDAPVPAMVSEPAPETTLTVGGDPGGMLSIGWPAALDVDGDPVTYVYHLSSSAAFADTVWSVETGDTSTAVGVGELAARLTALGVDEGTSNVFHHRVYASDTDTTVAGPSAGLTLMRGAVTGREDLTELPTEIILLPAYPNPFNPQTALAFGLPDAAEVRFEIFDILGRRVRTLSSGRKDAGWHRMTLDATGLATGSYVTRLEVGGITLTRTVVLLR